MFTTHYLNQTYPRQVLWFEKQDHWSFKVYNSAPEDPNSKCHWDLLSWWDDNTLRYVQTYHECPGSVVKDVIYDPPIIYLPRIWKQSQGAWSLEYESEVIVKENGITVCTGTNNYTTSILGWEKVNNKSLLEWRSEQTTVWDDCGACTGWDPTNWQEDYLVTDSLPIQEAKLAKGVRRSKGGNLGEPSDSWDITFDLWQLLP